MKFNSKTGEWADPQARFLCSFGIGEGLAALIAAGAADVGVGAATAGVIGEVGAGALIGAGGGAALGAATGGDPGMGALTGAISGGTISGLGPVVGDALGIGVTGGDALAGAGAGAVGSAIAGGNPLTGAALGAAGGLTTGLMSTTTPSGASASGATAPGTSAAAVAPAPGSGISGVSDLTVQPIDAVNPAPDIPSISSSGDLSSTIATANGGGSGVGPISAGPSGTVTPSTGAFQPAPAPQLDMSGIATEAPTLSTPGFDIGKTGGSTVSNFVDNPTLGNFGKMVGANAAPLVAGGGLLYNLFNKPSTAGLDQLNAEATALGQQGQELSSYIQSGKLPPGAQAALEQATKSAQASVRSKYASMGMSGSTAETQELNNVTLQAQAQAFSIADQLLKTGIDETGLAANIYEGLAQIDLAQSQQTGTAIASLAAALSGNGGLSIRLGG